MAGVANHQVLVVVQDQIDVGDDELINGGLRLLATALFQSQRQGRHDLN